MAERKSRERKASEPNDDDAVAQSRVGGFGEYEIDIEQVLRDTLPRKFDEIAPARLTDENVDALPLGAKGAYILLKDSQHVYAGKTDTRHGFRDRLARHVKSVSHRHGLEPQTMYFKALRIFVFSTFDAESILIEELRRTDKTALEWNDSGFGSNDPGRKRDEGEPGNFEKAYPIDIDIPFLNTTDEATTVANALRDARASAPYIFRFHVEKALADLPFRFSFTGCLTMRQYLNELASVLPPTYQFTLFHGRLILYAEDKSYEYARDMWRGRG